MESKLRKRAKLTAFLLGVFLFFLLSSAIGWITSYRPSANSFGIDGSDIGPLLRSYRGTLSIGWTRLDFSNEERHSLRLYRGFGIYWGWIGWQAYVPYWAIAVPSMIGSILLLRKSILIARANRPDGVHCARCGYDLRATPMRCPECGRAAGGRRNGICCVVRFGSARYILKRVPVARRLRKDIGEPKIQSELP